MSTLAYIILFSLLSGTLSLIGGMALLTQAGWVQRFSVHFVSYAAGVLLAAAFLDLLPEAFELTVGEPEPLLLATLAGFILLFLIERIFTRFHAHPAHGGHEAQHVHPHGGKTTPALLLVGDTIHNFIDGAVLAAAFLVSVPLGIVTALAVAAHELPQEIGDFSVMLSRGWDKAKVLWANVASSLANLLGALLVFTAQAVVEPLLPLLLAFTGGIFLYIAASDLIPEVTSHTQTDKAWHVAVLLLLGIATVWGFGLFLHV
ncbi:ZIP family metal transporter [Candidatus Berkelbacteria bacterium]|nr:ZIP family metal transporter [Candidatus Berkelbacteria bacterium]